MSTWIHILTLTGTVLFAVAILSRLVTTKETPGLITDGTNALANIFRGVFRG